MSAIININTGEIQDNTPYQTQGDLIAYHLVGDWTFATDEEVATYKQAQVQAQVQAELQAKLPLYQAENAFILYARSLALTDQATMQDFQAKALAAEAVALGTISLGDMVNGMAQFAEAVKIPLTALGLINDIMQAGGNWSTITWHDNISI